MADAFVRRVWQENPTMNDLEERIAAAGLVGSSPTPPVPIPPPSGSPPVFTTGAAILLNNASSLHSTGFESDPSWTDVGVQTGITLQATDKPHAGTKSFKVASGTLAGVYKTKSFSATNARRYSLVWYAWLASTSNGSGHLLGGFLDATAANWVSLAVTGAGLTQIATAGEDGNINLAEFPRDQWVKIELAATIDTGGTDTIELDINDVSWYSNTLVASDVLMTQIQFGSDYSATTATDLWIDDVVLSDPSSGTTDPGVSQPSGTALKSNSFAASGSPTFAGQWVSVTSTGTSNLRGIPQTIQPFTYSPVTADEGNNLYLDVTATNTYGSVTSRSPALAILTSGSSPGGPTPPPASGTFADLLADDMSGSSEALPAISSYGYDWAFNPGKVWFPPPTDFTAYAGWGVLDNVGSHQNVTVNIASIETWFKLYSAGGWVRVQYNTGVVAGAYYINSYTNQNIDAGQTAYAGGGTQIVAPPTGYNFHYYTDRGTMSPGDVAGVVTILRAKFVPNSYSGSPQMVMCAAGDWWRYQNAPWLSDYSNNGGIGVGKFKLVGASMRMFTMSCGDLSTLPPIAYSSAEMF